MGAGCRCLYCAVLYGSGNRCNCRPPPSLYYPDSVCEKGYPITDGVDVTLPASPHTYMRQG